MSQNRKLVIVASLAIVALSSSTYLFWQQERYFARPAPVPPGWQSPPLASLVQLPAELAKPDPRPHLIHFYDPGCPCSRFNLSHLSSLARQYGDRLRMTIVVKDEAGVARAAEQMARHRIGLPVVADASGAAGEATGVYSTPQAVLLDSSGRIYFRGNYNASRFCRDQRTEFARLAIEALLAGRSLPPLPAEATRAYGCPRTVTPPAGDEGLGI